MNIKCFVFALMVLVVAAPVSAQTKAHSTVAKAAEQAASFPGGDLAWKKFLRKMIDAKIALKNGAPVGKYTVEVNIQIDGNGQVTSIKKIKDPGYGTADDVIKSIRLSPQWYPAIKNGKYVSSVQKQSIDYLVERKR